MDASPGTQLGEIAGQLFSFVAFGLMAKWYVAPRLATLPRAQALTLVSWPRAFSFLAFQLFQAQATGLRISDFARDETVRLNAGGAALSIVLLILLRRGARLSIRLAWLVAIEFGGSLVFSMVTGARGHLLGTTTGISWLQVVFFQPVLVTACVLQVWQLVSRRGESLGVGTRRAREMSGPGASSRQTTLA
jgi:hypothetical protein